MRIVAVDAARAAELRAPATPIYDSLAKQAESSFIVELV